MSRIDELIGELQAHGSKFSWECANTMGHLHRKCESLNAEVDAQRYGRIQSDDRIAILEAELATLRAQVSHWKSNHDNQVARAALLMQRPDLPVDRIPAYRELERLQKVNSELAMQALADQAQELDMGYGPNGEVTNPRIYELCQLCAEAYQVVGVLASDAGRFDDPQVEKVLDNLSVQKMIHADVLPFRSNEKSPAPDNAPASVDGDKWLNQEIFSLIANLAAVVRIQNGNQHDDINTLLSHADCILAAPAVEPVAQKVTCPNKDARGNCPLPNVHCAYPNCEIAPSPKEPK